jgi:radical SAM protein with 4Fe4S-binding SPASM domain
MDEACAMGASHLYITGGEPLLREDFESVIDEATRRATTVVLSNGTCIDRHRIQTLDTLLSDTQKERLNFQISLDGPREIHDAQRGQGVFDRTIRGVELLIEWGSTPALTTALTSINVDTAHEAVALAARMGCRVHHVFLPHASGRLGRGGPCGKAGERELSIPSNERLLTALRACRETAQKLGITLSNQAVIEARAEEAGHRYDGCSGGKSMVAVAADGSLYPCPSLVMYKSLQDDKTTSLADAISVKKCSAMGAGTPESISGCSACEVRNICGGGCRAHAYHAHGTFEGRDPYCEVYRSFIGDFRMAAPERFTNTIASTQPDTVEPQRYRFGCT